MKTLAPLVLLVPSLALAQVPGDRAAQMEALRNMTPEERAWILQNPEAAREMAEMPPDQQQKLFENYQDLSEAEKQKLREHSNELRAMSDDEKAWALENPNALRQLGELPDGQRDQLIDAYRGLDPETQRNLREGFGGMR